jgi:ubiquinone/menaquinone biosynthesis C-methylase UbiE
MTFDNIDFNELYAQQKEASTFKAKDKAAWDKKAASMNTRVHTSVYNDAFLEKVNTQDCESLLDVGCGVGNLSLRLASSLTHIHALDYSHEMLDILQENAKKQDVHNIHTIEASWYDDWENIPPADIVIASRSMEVKDMKEALEKLNDKANKRVYISYKMGGSFLSDDILNAMQRQIIKKPDYIYLVNILYQMGIHAKVDFVPSEGRNMVYTSKEAFIQSVQWSIGNITQEERQRLEDYFEEEFVNKNEQNEYVYWAVISWEKK